MEAALSDLERCVHESDMPLLVQLALAHYQFEVIHPVIALQRAGYDTTATHIMITPTPTRHKAMGR